MNHSSTLIIPAIFAIFAVLFLISYKIKASLLKFKISMIFFIITGITTTLTSALGGSSMRKVEIITGVNLEALSNHARIGAASFILSILLLIIAVKGLRKGEEKLNLKFLFLTTVLFIVFYTISIYSSGKII